MRICCVGLTNVSLIIFDPQFAVTAIFLSKSYNFDQNQFFMPEFHVICRICCSMSYFCSLSNPNSRFLAFLASKSYNFDQNRIFVAEFKSNSRVSALNLKKSHIYLYLYFFSLNECVTLTYYYICSLFRLDYMFNNFYLCNIFHRYV